MKILQPCHIILKENQICTYTYNKATAIYLAHIHSLKQSPFVIQSNEFIVHLLPKLQPQRKDW